WHALPPSGLWNRCAAKLTAGALTRQATAEEIASDEKGTPRGAPFPSSIVHGLLDAGSPVVGQLVVLLLAGRAEERVVQPRLHHLADALHDLRGDVRHAAAHAAAKLVTVPPGRVLRRAFSQPPLLLRVQKRSQHNSHLLR